MNREPAPTGPRERAWSDAVWITVCLLVGLGVRGWLMASSSGLTMDSPTYVTMAESIARGERAIGYEHHGYPALVALASHLIPGRELPGRIVSLLSGLALIAVVYALARLRLPPAWSALAAGLVAVHPLLAVYGGAIMSEGAFLLFIFSALLLVEVGRPLLGGASLGAAYAVRPEAAAIALLAGLCSRLRARALVLLLVGVAVGVAPYAAYLRWDLGAWTLTNKTFLVQPQVDDWRAREYRVGDAEHPATEPRRSFLERVRWAAPSVASHLPRQLGRYAVRVLQAWPAPLLILSAFGAFAAPGSLVAPALFVLALALVPLPQELRFVQVAVPALAVHAAFGARRLAAAWRAPKPVPAAAVSLLLVGGLTWAWAGAAGKQAIHFDDGPMAEYRAAGEWLGAHGRPGATVMDRKAYVPFFARMKHTQLGDDDYDTIVEFARRSGVDYLVAEEFVAMTLRPQLAPLLGDRRFREAEQRLRLVHTERGTPGTGVAIFEVVRDSLPVRHLAR